MKEKEVFLKPDDRNRIPLTKVTKKLHSLYRAFEQDGRIILEPIIEIPDEEKWLFLPENKELLAKIKRGLKQKGTIDRGSFAQYLDDKDE